MTKYRTKVRYIGRKLAIFLIWSVFAGGPFSVRAQADRDSTKSFPWKLHLQSRYSLVENQLVGTWAGSVGYTWGPLEREVTLGYHWLGRRGTRQLADIEKEIALATSSSTYPRISAGFVNAGYWHIIKNSKRWKFGFPLEVGIGRATVRPHSLLDEPLSTTTQFSTIVPVQVGAYGEWKATRWVGIGFQGGYRYNLIRFDPINHLNGPYGRLRILVYPATYLEWFQFIFKKEPLPSPFYKKENRKL